MKLCVLTAPYYALSLEETLKKLSAMGVQAVELGAGGYPGDGHLKAAELLEDPTKLDAIKALTQKYNIEIAAIACHGNPVHPQKEVAASFDAQFKNAILLAEQLGVSTVVGFSGCPGDHDGAMYPNWVTCPWPDDFGTILEYQWNQVLIPYWKSMVRFANSHGIKKIALEMHPGFAVYNPETLLKLRAAVGDTIGANFDPSHLFWQGIDPVAAARAMQGAIYHVHAKDTRIDKINCAVNGVLDNKNYGNILERSWVFRTVGYGHGYDVWNDFFSALRTVGYDGAISIEHEDGLMSIDEGMQKAVAFLKKSILFESNEGMWWA